MDDTEKEKIKEELRDIFQKEKMEPKEIPGEAKIYFDGRQYSFKIPKKVGDALQIDTKKDRLSFVATIPKKYSKDNKPKFEGKLIRG